MKIQTNNVNGYHHTLSCRNFNERIMLTFALYKEALPDVWALQEVPTGGKSQACIRQLYNLALQHGYEIILPDKWKVNEHPKSFQSVLLLKNAKNIEVLGLDIKLYGRYNYVTAELEGNQYYIINIHAPQTELFPGHNKNDRHVRLRRQLAKQFYGILKEEIGKLLAAGKRVLLVGDFNRTLRQPEIKELMALGLRDIASVDDNTYADSVDYILVSQNIADEVSSAKCSIDTDVVRAHKLSDHATLQLDIAI